MIARNFNPPPTEPHVHETGPVWKPAWKLAGFTSKREWAAAQKMTDRVQRKGCPEVIDALLAREITLTQAAWVVTHPKSGQPAALKRCRKIKSRAEVGDA